jgi:hypothetical protein
VASSVVEIEVVPFRLIVDDPDKISVREAGNVTETVLVAEES